jgi:hypothetical protein
MLPRQEKPSSNQEIVWDDVCKHLKSHFNSKQETPHARFALAKFVSLGCDERTMLQDLFLYCGGDPGQMQATRTELDFPKQREQILNTAKLLLEVSSEIQSVERLLKELDIKTRDFTPNIVPLEQYSQLLSKIGNGVYSRLASGKISGREQHLLHLCRTVRDMTPGAGR